MSEPDVERSESGSPIYRHKMRQRDFELAAGDSECLEIIEQHVMKHVGDPANVFHELVSDLVHVDIHVVAPTEKRDYYTLVTTGMSDRAMNPPEAAADWRHAELLICLPPSWPLQKEGFENEQHYWPLRWLKVLARLPHEFQTWLWVGHTVPNGDPPEPFASNTGLCCALLSVPVLFDEDFLELKVSDEKTVRFFSLIPIYRDEMEFKLKHGFDALMERLIASGVTELLDVNRKSVCKRRLFGLF